MLENLHIKNFRGISSLRLNDLGRVNILLGENGVGKTTILEAVSIASARAPEQFLRIGKWREFGSSPSEVLRSIFYKLDLASPPEFVFSMDGKEHQVSCKVLTIFDSNGTAEKVAISNNGQNGSTDQDDTFRGINTQYITPDGLESEISYFIQTQQTHIHQQHINPLNRLGCFFIHGRRATSIHETAKALTKIAYNVADENLFLDTLRSIEPRIKRIRPGVEESGPTVLVDIGLKQMLPLNVMGDGFCRIALMLTGIMGSNSRLLVIDEIDSGLHHSVMADFWKHCIMLTQQFDVQLFCTTHNEEILDAAIEAFNENPDLIRAYRLEHRNQDEMYVASYDYSSLRNSDLAGFEIR